MTECKRCNDTGKIGVDEFCTCSTGEIKKRVDRAEKRAERQKEAQRQKNEAARILKKRQEEKLKEQYKPPCGLFDWVEYIDYVGTVQKINYEKQEILFEAFSFTDGRKAKGRTWIDWDDVEILPIEKTAEGIRSLIDLALDANDQERFFELTNELMELIK